MAIAPSTRAEKNIWVAASDGDLERVKELVETHGLSPNAPDPHTYTPMHAAASYGHLELLEYLTSHGGDVDVADGDGDTPLYTVEDVATAQFLVEHGATVQRLNSEGVSPIEHLKEEFSEVSAYLLSLTPSSGDPTAMDVTPIAAPSQHTQNLATEELTSELMTSVGEIIQRAEAEGTDPDEELRTLVTQTVVQGFLAGYDMQVDAAEGEEDGGDVKRTRTE